MTHPHHSLLDCPGIDLALLASRARDASRWASINLDFEDIEESLRSTIFKPDVDIRDLSVNDEQKASAVEELSSKRKGHVSTIETQGVIDEVKGRVLVFYPIRSLADALVGGECEYFIDEDDVPAWDIWLQYIPTWCVDGYGYDACLLCYVPEALVDKVDTAIQAYCYESFRWADEFSGKLSAFEQS